ncbi:MAG: SOS response-associated peptidase [Methylobacterium mesophilicum]|nr:SOS response-associated peptidase [Methylobacterium mesophilicum]
MCNLYTLTKGPEAIRKWFGDVDDTPFENQAGNLQPDDFYPDSPAPVMRKTEKGVELVRLRWGMPSPLFAVKDRETDPGVTNIRNAGSPHWRRWLGPAHRCVVPANRFCEWENTRPKKTKVWFALDDEEPLFFFAGIWTPWHGTRKKAEGPQDHELFGFLTTDANAVVKPIHPKAMPVLLTTPDEVRHWLEAPAKEALTLQRPLPDETLKIIGRGELGTD